MADHLDPRLSIGTRFGDLEIVAVVPHATRPATWAVAARHNDGTYSTWTAEAEASKSVPTHGFGTIEEALADMLRRARS